MIKPTFRTAAFGLGALLLASASIVSAQYAERPADRLSRHLRELAADPQNVTALIGAGQASLDVGDGNAALGFFARADEKAPRNGQVKAGLARSLLMVDNPREALKMFDAARSLGIADVQLAPDRGLAYDLKGDNKRAQQDYALVLAQGPNDEVTKRYALSLGITGDRERALQLLQPLLYKRDQGAWRARAFVMALTGDAPGASKIVHQVMPARMAQTMDGFLPRLAALSPAQKAAAVHLGEMPSDVRFASNTAQPPAYVAAGAAPAFTPAPTPTPTPTASPTREPESREGRRRPGATALMASPPPPKVVKRRGGAVQVAAAPTPTPTPEPPAPVQLAENDTTPAFVPTMTPTPRPTYSPPPRPTYTPPPKPVKVARAPSPTPTAQPAPLPTEQRGDLEAIIASIREAAAAPRPTPTPTRLAQAKTTAPKGKPTPTPSPAAKGGPSGKDAADKDAKPDPKSKAGKAAAAAAAKKKAEPKNPARIWVQVAGGANAGDLPKEWAGVAGKHAELKGKGPYTAKNRATNRLLAGPFKSEAEAQAAVAKLRKAGIGAFQWKSDEGEAVQKIGGK